MGNWATRELTAALWPQMETLFGSNGACGGCWCMSWRIGKGERWDDVKGDEARRRAHSLVTVGRAHGVLAFDGETPIGWCSFGPRRDYLKLDRAPSLACDDADAVWSIPCFFVRNGYRGKGVGKVLLAAAVEAIAARGGRIAEGYPVKPDPRGRPTPAAFAWTGTRRLFEAAGFVLAGNPDGGKQRMRKAVG